MFFCIWAARILPQINNNEQPLAPPPALFVPFSFLRSLLSTFFKLLKKTVQFRTVQFFSSSSVFLFIPLTLYWLQSKGKEKENSLSPLIQKIRIKLSSLLQALTLVKWCMWCLQFHTYSKRERHPSSNKVERYAQDMNLIAATRNSSFAVDSLNILSLFCLACPTTVPDERFKRNGW